MPMGPRAELGGTFFTRRIIESDMSRHPYPEKHTPPTRRDGRSVAVTIPHGLVDEADIEPGVTPEWEWDDEAGEVVMRIAD